MLPNGGGTPTRRGRGRLDLHAHAGRPELDDDERLVLARAADRLRRVDRPRRHVDGRGQADLAIAIGLNSATLNTRRAVTAQLTGITGIFDVQVDLMQAAQAISDPASLLSAFSVPGEFTLGVAGLSINVPGAINVTASGISIHIDPGHDQSMGHNDPLVTVNSAHVTFPSFGGVGGGVDEPRRLLERLHARQRRTSRSRPAGGINFFGLLVFNDLTFAIQNFGVTFDNGGTLVQQHRPGRDERHHRLLGRRAVPAGQGGQRARSPTARTPTGRGLGDVQLQRRTACKAFVFNADQLSINLGSFLTLTATDFQINTGASATAEPRQLRVRRAQR